MLEGRISRGWSGMPELETAKDAEYRGPAGDWHALRSNPDYKANWRANAGPPSGVASAGFALRAQTEGDLEAARWGLLAWEDPRERSKFKPFWMDGKMLEAEVVEPGESVDPVNPVDPVGMMVRATGMSVSGLLLGGALVLKVKRGRRMEQIRVLEGERFDLERSGLQLQFGFDGHPSSVLPRLWNLAAIMKLRKGVALDR